MNQGSTKETKAPRWGRFLLTCLMLGVAMGVGIAQWLKRSSIVTTAAVQPTITAPAANPTQHQNAKAAPVNPMFLPMDQLPIELTDEMSKRPRTNKGILLPPSAGSLLPVPMPRELAETHESWRRLPPLRAVIAATTPEEATWMDFQNFPTQAEIDGMTQAQIGDVMALRYNNLRALAVWTGIACQKRDLIACKRGAGRLANLGSPYGVRLMIELTLKEPRVANGWVRESHLVMWNTINNMLGDGYEPASVLYGESGRTLGIGYTFTASRQAAHFVQRSIPRIRSNYGLPPLQIVRAPPNYITGYQ